mmetsp:Transcript_34062/g.80171  ORF Transcript_34062/g.80171 Transcript_34062/m.80171 type:complete len:216 (+) Transcript_34062:1655-2302(+)
MATDLCGIPTIKTGWKCTSSWRNSDPSTTTSWFRPAAMPSTRRTTAPPTTKRGMNPCHHHHCHRRCHRRHHRPNTASSASGPPISDGPSRRGPSPKRGHSCWTTLALCGTFRRPNGRIPTGVWWSTKSSKWRPERKPRCPPWFRSTTRKTRSWQYGSRSNGSVGNTAVFLPNASGCWTRLALCGRFPLPRPRRRRRPGMSRPMRSSPLQSFPSTD